MGILDTILGKGPKTFKPADIRPQEIESVWIDRTGDKIDISHIQFPMKLEGGPPELHETLQILREEAYKAVSEARGKKDAAFDAPVRQLPKRLKERGFTSNNFAGCYFQFSSMVSSAIPPASTETEAGFTHDGFFGKPSIAESDRGTIIAAVTQGVAVPRR